MNNIVVFLVRLLGGVTFFLSTFLIVRFFDSYSIGLYYLVVSVSYLGNSLFFVGVDVCLQKKISQISSKGMFSFPSVIKYIFIMGLCGGSMFFPVFYLFYTMAGFDNYYFLSVLSIFSMLSVYFNLSARNIFQLGNKKIFSNLVIVMDGLTKSVFISISVFFSLDMFTLLMYLSLISLSVNFFMICTTKKYFSSDCSNGFNINKSDFFKVIVPSGIMGGGNWLQLHSYRPVFKFYDASLSSLGALSFLLNIGGSVTTIFMSVLGQNWIPKIYSDERGALKSYVKIILLLSLFLSFFSLPSGYFFLYLTDKTEFNKYLYVIPIGVLSESINSVIGAFIHSLNHLGKSLRKLSLISFSFCFIVFLFYIYISNTKADFVLSVSLSILMSQLSILLYMFLFLKSRRNCD